MSDVITAAVAALQVKMAGGFSAGLAKFVIPGEGAIMIDHTGVRAGDEPALRLAVRTDVTQGLRHLAG